MRNEYYGPGALEDAMEEEREAALGKGETPRPWRLYACKEMEMTLDAERIIEDAWDDLHDDTWDDLHDDAWDQVIHAAPDLQRLLDAWLKENKPTTTNYADFATRVVLVKSKRRRGRDERVREGGKPRC